MLEEGLLVVMEESDVTDKQVDPDSPCQFDRLVRIVGDENAIARFAQRLIDQLSRSRALLEDEDRGGPRKGHGGLLWRKEPVSARPIRVADLSCHYGAAPAERAATPAEPGMPGDSR